METIVAGNHVCWLEAAKSGTRVYLIPAGKSDEEKGNISRWLQEADTRSLSDGDIQTLFTQNPTFCFVEYEPDQVFFTWTTDGQSSMETNAPVIYVATPQNMKYMETESLKQTVELSRLENAIVNTLSGGEQQRVALARTMLKPGRLILADEPTGALDAKAAELSFSLIKGLCRKYHKTVIMVTHSLDLAQRTDRVIDLANYK